MKTRILFVDDEPNVLQGLKRIMRTMRNEWEMAFAGSGDEALEIISEDNFDVIVTDMRMPGMDGEELLTEVIRRYPWMVRIILSGESDKEMIIKSVRQAHQFLSKPCEPEKLKAVVAKTTALQVIMNNDSVKKVVSRIESLPALPELYTRVISEIDSKNSSIERIGRIISKDIGMSAEILKMVNSSFFGFYRKISSPQQAIILLGLDTVKALILSSHIISSYEFGALPISSIKALNKHSMTTAFLAKKISESETRDQNTIDQSFIAGLLHDVGKIIITSELIDDSTSILEMVYTGNCHVWEAESQILGITHAEIGAFLLGLWGFPIPVIEALAFHHNPLNCQSTEFSPLTAVHVANCMEHELIVFNQDYLRPACDPEYLSSLGLADRLIDWRSICEKNIVGNYCEE